MASGSCHWGIIVMMFRPLCCLTRLRQQLKPEIDPCQDPSSPSLCFCLGKLSEWLFSCENTSISHPVAIRRTRYISLFSQILPLSRAGRSLGRIPLPPLFPSRRLSGGERPDRDPLGDASLCLLNAFLIPTKNFQPTHARKHVPPCITTHKCPAPVLW